MRRGPHALLQVVSNSILDRTFTVNNKTFVNPIHDNIFESLSQLGSNFTRFVPWFPLPHLAVAELDAPVDGKPTSWNFTYVIPQFQVTLSYMVLALLLGFHPADTNLT